MIKKITLLIAALLLIAVIISYILVTQPMGEVSQSYTVRVQPNDTATDLRAKLTAAGVRLNPTVYSALMVLTGTDRRIQPGRYQLAGSLSHYDLINVFQEGRVETCQVTIPEGLCLWEIAAILVREAEVDSSRLAQILTDSAFFASFGISASGFEGFLFPETYTFFAEDSPENVINTMINMFKSVFDEEKKQKAEELGFTLNELVTLASLIEAEATTDSERELISSVFHNRLHQGWKLQCDPTVIYAMGGLERPLWKRDLDYDSPYNTYLHYGLPPGPICSPGRAALEAALYPADTRYFYFVADGQGGHIFSETFREHSRAIKQVKRQRKTDG
ncbi:MAG: endolytic transglycosylase MltG [candidate division Zixibacteria bacterium]|nr:endolytic transglycosylase MltG [candidate division Zixibacteria bacterium]